MGILASGQINMRAARLFFDGDLQDLLDAASATLYPATADKEAIGWGSFFDDDSVVGQSSRLAIHASRPKIVAETEDKPAQLRMRLYYDKVNVPLRKRFGAVADWRDVCLRHAVDVVVFNGDAENGYLTQIASRDDTEVSKRVIPELYKLLLSVDDHGKIVRDLIPEVLPDDLFTWILSLFSREKDPSADLSLDKVREIRAVEGQVHGAKFSDLANMDRVGIASMVLEGNSTFGPAKLNMTSASLGLAAHMEVFPDGGFSAFRSSFYFNEEVADEEMGIRLVEDMSLSILPELRRAYGADSEWRRSGMADLRKIASERLSPLVLPQDRS